MSDDYMDAHIRKPIYAPEKLYVWLVSEDGEHRIRKWDVRPFTEANYVCGATEDLQKPDRTEALLKALEVAEGVLNASYHALRSYQYGNGAPDLAEQTADATEQALTEIQRVRGTQEGAV